MMKQMRIWLSLVLLGSLSLLVEAAEKPFAIVDGEIQANILCDPNDFTVVQKAADMLAQDIKRVTGKRPAILHQLDQAAGNVIVIGSITRSAFIQTLQAEALIDTDAISGQWECYACQTLEHPLPNIDTALVIVGSDRRGTAYGVVDVSAKIGVSPWVWWADVVPARQDALILKELNTVSPSPAVKYRGLFLNDEDWGLQPWAARTLEPETGDIGPRTYARIFELMLRLKANLIWPAMHICTKAFYHYPENRQVADDYAIVVGSSHTEPMLCNNDDEWDRRQYGPYNYVTNGPSVYRYWQRRAIESRSFENVYTMGMRGIGDSGIIGVRSMADKVAIMNQIFTDQREIIRSDIDPDVTEVSQAFIPYKEVLEIYDAGLTLPEDITLVWPDDNYGYIRRLNNPREMQRSGGGGVYYHLSYWGRPHDYLWLSITHPALIRAEMTKAWQLKSDRMWVFNVGDIKPVEYNLSLCLDMAWSAGDFTQCGTEKEHLRQWHQAIFGPSVGAAVAEIIWEYYNLAFERRPEFMGWSQVEPRRRVNSTQYHHFFNNDEAQQRLDHYHALVKQVEILKPGIPARLADAYFQLVTYPVVCAAAMNDKILYQEKAMLYAQQSRASATDYAAWAQQAYQRIVTETDYYNQDLAQGKWRHMMSMAPRNLLVFQRPMQAHWEVPNDDSWGLAVEGCRDEQPTPDLYMRSSGLPTFNRWTRQSYFIDLFMKGRQSVTWQAQPSADWITVTPSSGTLTASVGRKQQRLWVSIDWGKAPANTKGRGHLSIAGAGRQHRIEVEVINRDVEALNGFTGCIEENRYVSIFAEHYRTIEENNSCTWNRLDGLGHTGSSIMAGPLVNPPQIDPSQLAGHTAIATYDFFTFSQRPAEVAVYGLPTHPINEQHSLRFALAIDDRSPHVLDFKTFGRSETWKLNVLSNTAQAVLKTDTLKPGRHQLKLYAIDPGVIIDRFTIDLGGLEQTYGVVQETRVLP
jgi:hypothetical protein